MNCFYCKGKLTASITTHVVKLKTCIIIVKNVPCTECIQCGEVFFDNEVALQLERIFKELKTAIMEVTIVNYNLAA
jgi:YgiT-type zinc finger domain-containing protein